jgi:hypothetical protein
MFCNREPRQNVMLEPKVDVEYWLVRIEGDTIKPASFERFVDGSACALFGGCAGIADEDPDAWKGLWEDLSRRGYLLVDEAKSKGLLSPDWCVPDEFGQSEATPPD